MRMIFSYTSHSPLVMQLGLFTVLNAVWQRSRPGWSHTDSSLMMTNCDHGDFLLSFCLSSKGQSCQSGRSRHHSVRHCQELGGSTEQHFNTQNRISMTCRSAYAHLRHIARVGNFIPQKTVETCVHAFITSRLDNCNALFCGWPDYVISRLQSVQNSAARVVTQSHHTNTSRPAPASGSGTHRP